MISRIDVQRVALLIQYVRIDAESLQQLLPLLVRTLPLLNAECALAYDKSIEHLLVLICYTDGLFFLGVRIQAADLSWC